MTKITYNSTSPYYKTPQTSWYLDNLTIRNISSDGTDILMILDKKYNNLPNLLSYDLYGSSDYWWVFCVRNPDIITDPIYDFITGIQIYVPTYDRLSKLLT